jgi:hypothetical protein
LGSFYVGLVKGSLERVVFSSLAKTSEELEKVFGNTYGACIGPFQHKHAAQWCADHPYSMITHVSQFEKRSKKERRQNRGA